MPPHPVLKVMLDYWLAQPEVKLENVTFASNASANQLVKDDINAFVFAASLDRGGQAFQLWNIPWRLKQEWGHLDPAIIQEMTIDEVAALPAIVSAPSMASRAQLAKAIISAAALIQTHCDGDAAKLFEGNASEIVARLQQIFGVGPGIARMMVIQRMLYFGLAPVPGGRLLPKIDVLVQRVFLRTGLSDSSTDAEVSEALIGLSEREVAIVDQVGWKVGKTWCFATNPNCSRCPLSSACKKNNV